MLVSLQDEKMLEYVAEDEEETAAKIEEMIVMGVNICSEMEIYAGVPAPVQETNVAVRGQIIYILLHIHINFCTHSCFV